MCFKLKVFLFSLSNPSVYYTHMGPRHQQRRVNRDPSTEYRVLTCQLRWTVGSVIVKSRFSCADSSQNVYSTQSYYYCYCNTLFWNNRLLVVLFHFTEPFYANAIVSIIIADTCLCQLQRKTVEDDVTEADKYL